MRAEDVTTNIVGDAPIQPESPDHIPGDQTFGSVTADGASETRKRLGAIAASNAHAAMPSCNNAESRKPTSVGTIARNDAVNASRYFSRTISKRWSEYQGRNRVETKMDCVNGLGQPLMARDFKRQVTQSRSLSLCSIVARFLAYL